MMNPLGVSGPYTFDIGGAWWFKNGGGGCTFNYPSSELDMLGAAMTCFCSVC